MEKVLLLFSGGKDSMLSTCRLVNNGYETNLVAYDNGYELAIENIANCAKRLIKVKGEEKIKYLGTFSTIGIYRSFFLPLFNMKPSEISSKYGEATISQLNCLMCRSAMYIYSIILCKILGIKNIAEGARESQQFVIEQKPMLDLYQELLSEYSIDLLLPVISEISDFHVENELLMNGLVPKTFESQCLLGCPIDKNHPITAEVIEGTIDFYLKEILPKIPKLIELNEKPIRLILERNNFNTKSPHML